MTVRFNTSYHLPLDTPFPERLDIVVEVAPEHELEAIEELKQLTGNFEAWTRRGLAEGWIYPAVD